MDGRESRSEQKAEQQILRTAHDEEATLQALDDVVCEHVRDADHQHEHDDRAELARAARAPDPLAACATPGDVAQTSATAVKISLPAISVQL